MAATSSSGRCRIDHRALGADAVALGSGEPRDRTETYQYFATDPVPGYEHYTQEKGLKSAIGSHGDLVNGKVRIEAWNAIGTGASMLGIGSQSAVRIPFA